MTLIPDDIEQLKALLQQHAAMKIQQSRLRQYASQVGRKNYLFFGSDNGGEAAAIMYSLLGTCKLNGVEPEGWLREVISKITDWPSNRVDELLPWNFPSVK